MKYIEVTLHIAPLDPFKDLMVYALGDEGPYDSFTDIPDGVKAYVPADQYDEAFLKQAIADAGCQISYEVAEMPDKNWNEVWEAGHQPVLVETFCWVRAPFHPHRNDVESEIEIEPKMSFGTGHHETTSQMIGHILKLELHGKKVLDMGCGTSILGILASMCGAESVTAIDIDEWCYKNSLENIALNHTGNIRVMCGDASLLKGMEFDVILANINRNILLNDIPTYAKCLRKGGQLIVSGFYDTDIPAISEICRSCGLSYAEHTEKNKWVAVKYMMYNV